MLLKSLIYYKKLIGNNNFVRYVYLGFFNFTFITVVTYLNFEYLNLNENLSFIISIFISFFINLLTLKYYVFRSNKKTIYLGIRFAFFSFCLRVIEACIFSLIIIFDIYYLLASTVVLSISFILKFFIYKKFVF